MCGRVLPAGVWRKRRGGGRFLLIPTIANLAPEGLGTEPARDMLPTSGRTFRRTALGEPDTTTDRRNGRDPWATDTMLG